MPALSIIFSVLGVFIFALAGAAIANSIGLNNVVIGAALFGLWGLTGGFVAGAEIQLSSDESWARTDTDLLDKSMSNVSTNVAIVAFASAFLFSVPGLMLGAMLSFFADVENAAVYGIVLGASFGAILGGIGGLVGAIIATPNRHRSGSLDNPEKVD